MKAYNSLEFSGNSEFYSDNEQANSRASYLRMGIYKNTIVLEIDRENRYNGNVEHCFEVRKIK